MEQLRPYCSKLVYAIALLDLAPAIKAAHRLLAVVIKLCGVEKRGRGKGVGGSVGNCGYLEAPYSI